MSDSIFTKIIKGEIPCHKVYEDDNTLAFLDIHPVSEGHTLVISKRQVDFVWNLESSEYRSLMDACKKIANRLRETTGKTYVGEQIVGVDVAHAHVHLIPFDKVSEFRNIPDMNVEPDHDTLSALAKKLAF